MPITQYATPTVSLDFSDEEYLDLTTAQSVYVTFKCGSRVITKTGDDLVILPKRIDVYLQQEETGKFDRKVVEVQANWIDAYGNRVPSVIRRIEVKDQLLKRVIE